MHALLGRWQHRRTHKASRNAPLWGQLIGAQLGAGTETEYFFCCSDGGPFLARQWPGKIGAAWPLPLGTPSPIFRRPTLATESGPLPRPLPVSASRKQRHTPTHTHTQTETQTHAHRRQPCKQSRKLVSENLRPFRLAGPGRYTLVSYALVDSLANFDVTHAKDPKPKPDPSSWLAPVGNLNKSSCACRREDSLALYTVIVEAGGQWLLWPEPIATTTTTTTAAATTMRSGKILMLSGDHENSLVCTPVSLPLASLLV